MTSAYLQLKAEFVAGIDSKTKTNNKHITNVDTLNYDKICCPIKDIKNVGSLPYTEEEIINKLRSGLKMYKSETVESIFIEIVNINSNIITCCKYINFLHGYQNEYPGHLG